MRSRHAQLSGSGLQAAKNKVRGFSSRLSTVGAVQHVCGGGALITGTYSYLLTYLLTYCGGVLLLKQTARAPSLQRLFGE